MEKVVTLITGGEVMTPASAGTTDILLVLDRIARIGRVDADRLDILDIPVRVIDARGRLVIPGIIDPHEHLLGGGGEGGMSSHTPELSLREIIMGGVTTVVGCLGVDTRMKTMAGLLAKAKGFREESLNAHLWSGGYSVPPRSLLDSVREDIMFIDEVIGAGEIAISDHRSVQPGLDELARLVIEARIGGMIGNKAGVTHFHVGAEKEGLDPIRKLLENFPIPPECIYPTHVERNEKLLLEAVELTKRGVTVDIDTVEQDLPRWLRLYLEMGGDPQCLTLSSDSGSNGPGSLLRQIARAVTEVSLPLEMILRMVTLNTARVLHMDEVGELATGKSADVVILERGSLEVVHVFARGRHMVRDGAPSIEEKFRQGKTSRWSRDEF